VLGTSLRGLAGLAAALTIVFGSVGSLKADQKFVPATNLAVQVAQAAGDGLDDVNDPLESVNRVIFDFNEVFYQYIVRPIATIYKENLPDPVQRGVNNFLANLSSPVVFANDLLQGKPDKAMETFGRFLINSSVGFGGLRDAAAEIGIERQNEDFGQTLGYWGVGEGFYLVIPIFGPSNPRDAVGKFLVDGYFDPVNLWANNTDREYIIYSRAVVDGIDTYAGVMDELDEIKKTSIDYYAAIRSMYRQKRAALIRDGKPADLAPIPEMNYDLPAPSLR
jgi:phospholipid-binding lipoprotein MlaA